MRIKEANGDWWFVQRDFLDHVEGATSDGSLQAVRCRSIESLLENTNVSEVRTGVNSGQWRAIAKVVPVPAGATHVLVQLRTWKPDEATVDFDSFVLTLE